MLSYRTVLQNKCSVKNVLRYVSINSNQTTQKSSPKVLSSNELRSSFIEFFVQNHNHDFVRSSSVKPSIHDKSLLFVNAGMNQFKPIFLDQIDKDESFAAFRGLNRATNSQKCIRVGGKHCDLDNVGTDFKHHTFFEMLGNWSFNDYFKKEACEMAWTLLTKVYGIDPSRLIVTIFAGMPDLNLPRDDETYDIWRSIGVPPDRIVELGMKDNFWEMGQTGPCGICTEIHYQLNPIDSTQTITKEQADQALMNASIEIWNIVFIQYFRDITRTLNRLDKNFVDTGMGLERILSLVQGVNNNYQTDLFTPFFQKIHAVTRWPEYSGQLDNLIDVSYRILADHSRMAAVSIADGVVPEDRGAGYLLRRVIRRSLFSIKTLTKQNLRLPNGITDIKLLQILADTTAESLGDAFPELKDNIKNIHEVLEDEIKLYNSAFRRSETIMKLTDSLKLELTEDENQNKENIVAKCDLIASKLDSIQHDLSLSKPKISPYDVDLVNKNINSLITLVNSNQVLAERFGFKDEQIIEKLSSLEERAHRLRTQMDEILIEIVELVRTLTKRKLKQNNCYSILQFSNDVFEYSSIDFLLLKIAGELYGCENPLLVILKQPEQNAFLIQMTVPGEFENSLNAEKWASATLKKFKSLSQNGEIFRAINRRTLKRLVRYRIRCLNSQDVDRCINIFQDQAIETIETGHSVKVDSCSTEQH